MLTIMAEQDSASADEQADTESERTEYAWATQTPTTRLTGTPVGIIYSDTLDDTEAQNDSSFGLVLEDPSVVVGEVWENQIKPDDGLTADGVGEDASRPTDYRIIDPDDQGTGVKEIGGERIYETEELPQGEHNIYEQADEINEDTLIVWYNGMSGERIGRVLDFNGRPFARWTSDGYLVKGLFQVADGWREADGSTRHDMKDSGQAPRVARAPILRQRVEIDHDDEGNISDVTLLDDPNDQQVLIDISRFQGGRGYEAHVFDSEAFEAEFGSLDAALPRNDDGYVEDTDSELEMAYTPTADDVLEQAGYRMHMYTGEGWQNEPDNWSPQSTSEVSSFGVSADAGDGGGADGFTAAQEQFIREVVDETKGTGLTPDEVFNGGLAGLIGKYSDQFSRVPDEDAVREEVYSRVSHLDPADLDE